MYFMAINVLQKPLCCHRTFISITKQIHHKRKMKIEFDKSNIPADGSCFYHAISSSLYGVADGRRLLSDLHSMWNSTDFDDKIIRKKTPLLLFYNSLWRYHVISQAKKSDILDEREIKKRVNDLRILYASSRREATHKLVGEKMFGRVKEGKWADDFTINMVALLLDIEIVSLIASENRLLTTPMSPSITIDTRFYPMDFSPEERFRGFRDWNPSARIIISYYDVNFRYGTLGSVASANHYSTVSIGDRYKFSSEDIDTKSNLDDVRSQFKDWLLERSLRSREQRLQERLFAEMTQ
jgi:hypothetical protein